MDDIEKRTNQLENQYLLLSKGQALIEDTLEKLQISVEAIRKALLGDEMIGDGWIKKMMTLQERVEKLERMYDRFRYFLIGATIAGGYGIFELIRKFFV